VAGGSVKVKQPTDLRSGRPEEIRFESWQGMNPFFVDRLLPLRHYLDKQRVPLLASKFSNLYANLGEFMQVKINGKSEEVPSGTVLDLLKTKKIEPQMVAVEVNDKMLERDHLATTPVNEGDQIEFLFYMGGGQ